MRVLLPSLLAPLAVKQTLGLILNELSRRDSFSKGGFWAVPVSVELQQPESSCCAAGVARLKAGPSVIARLQQAGRGLS